MPHLNNKISEKTYKWSAVSNAFTGNAKVFAMLNKDGYTHVEFVTESGTSLHKIAVPNAEATLGTYATRAGNMARESCTWEQAKAPRKSTGARITITSLPTSASIAVVDGKVVISMGEASVSIDSELNLTASVVRYTESDSMSLVYKKADAFVRNCVLTLTPNWLDDNFKTSTWAVAGTLRVGIEPESTIKDARQALYDSIEKSGDWSLMGQVVIEKTGLSAVGDWLKARADAIAEHE